MSTTPKIGTPISIVRYSMSPHSFRLRTLCNRGCPGHRFTTSFSSISGLVFGDGGNWKSVIELGFDTAFVANMGERAFEKHTCDRFPGWYQLKFCRQYELHVENIVQPQRDRGYEISPHM